jgi:adenosylmethionine-8-amino-7-oxononanoate aminotransferase
MLPGCHHLPSPFLYRNEYGLEDGEALVRAIARKFEAEIEFQGANTIAALIMEPVLGAGGVIVPPASLFATMREICDRHGILLISDEVITAYGRVGAACGARLWGVRPDIMTTAKALTNGYFPLGAVMLSERIGDAFEANRDTRGTISHGYTYSGHPVGAAAAIATLGEIARLNVAENARLRGDELLAGFQTFAETYELIGNVRGKGLMLAMELVSDREKKTPAGKATVAAFFDAAYRAGLMTRTSGNTIILSPALIISPADVARMLDCIKAGLEAATATV